MQIQDILVGLIAIAAGLSLVAIGALNVDGFFHSWKTRWITQRMGRTVTRFTVALLGMLLVLLGIAIMRGFGPNASGEQSCRSSEVTIAGLFVP